MSGAGRFSEEFAAAARETGHFSQVQQAEAAAAAASRAASGQAARSQGGKGDDSIRIRVSNRQRSNPLLRFVRHVRYDFTDLLPDFDVGDGACVLFLSLRFHILKPEYIVTRVKALRHEYRLRMLLVLVDLEDNERPILELTEMCLTNSMTLVLAWSNKEAARYIETLKLYEKRTADAIKERVEPAYADQVVDTLTSVRSVNRTDAAAIVSTMGSVRSVLLSSPDAMSMVPGFGPKKAQQLHDVLHAPIGSGPPQ